MVGEFTTLEIAGNDGHPVPNQFLRQHEDTSTLAVLLPGQGYTARMPLFYYAEQMCIERGWDVLSVDYAYPPLEYDDDPGFARSGSKHGSAIWRPTSMRPTAWGSASVTTTEWS